MRFRYSTTDPYQDEFDSLPRIPLTLHYESRSVDVVGLIDSGATVNVLPYQVGTQLGATWDDGQVQKPGHGAHVKRRMSHTLTGACRTGKPG